MLAGDERRYLFGGHRPGEVEALTDRAAVRLQELELPCGLDAFGKWRHVKPSRELDHRPHHAREPGITMHVADERSVDLQDVHRQVLQPGER